MVVGTLPLVWSCATQGNKDAIEIKQKNLEEQLTRHNKEVNEGFKTLLDINKDLRAKVTQLNDRVHILEQDIMKLYKQLMTRDNTKNPNTDLDPKDVAVKTAKVLSRLKDDSSFDDLKAYEELKSFGTSCISMIVNDLKHNLTGNPDFAGRIEKLIARFPVEQIKSQIETLIIEQVSKVSVVRIVRYTRDKGLSELVVPFASSVDDEFKSQLVLTLIECKNRAGIPVGLELLSSSDENVRLMAVTALKSVSKDDFGYRFFEKPDTKENQESISKFKSWYGSVKESVWK